MFGGWSEMELFHMLISNVDDKLKPSEYFPSYPLQPTMADTNDPRVLMSYWYDSFLSKDEATLEQFMEQLRALGRMFRFP